VESFGEATETDAAGGEVVQDGQGALSVAPEAVELPDRGDVTIAEMIEAGIKLWAAGRRAADAVVDEDAGGPGVVQAQRSEAEGSDQRC
jgi:hypothetical protein